MDARSQPPLPPIDEAHYLPATVLPWHKKILFLFGLPVETAQSTLQRTPWATRSLAFFICVCSFAFWSVVETPGPWLQFIYQPHATGAQGWLGLLAYGFIHADLLHLLGNLYFLLIFGDNVECRFGPWRTLGLFLAASIAGAWLHGAFAPLGLIGASSGVFGILLFYACQFPRARILWLPFGLFVRIVFFFMGKEFVPRGFNIYVYLTLYGGLQLILAYEQLFQAGEVSALAHLGGGLAGLLIWIAWRRRWIP